MAESMIKVTPQVSVDRTYIYDVVVTNTSPNARYLTLTFNVSSTATGLLSNYTQIQINFSADDIRLSAYNGSTWTTLARWAKTS